jgi:phage tail P2-like protein
MPNAYQAVLQVMQERFDALPTSTPRAARNPTVSPVQQLGHLAWSRGLDYWDPAWPESVKRQLALVAPTNLRRRGTRAAIESALDAFASQLVIEEWWEQTPEGVPCTANAQVIAGTALGTSVEAQETVQRILARESRLACHFDIIVGETAVDAVGPFGSARAAVLHQYSGAQIGA